MSRRLGRDEPWSDLGVEPGEYALVTLHRPALVDDPALLAATVDGLVTLAGTCPGRLPGAPAHARAPGGRGSRATARAMRACCSAARSATSPSSGSRPRRASSSPTRAACRRRPRRWASAASRCATRPSAPVTVELGTNVVLGADPPRSPRSPEAQGAEARQRDPAVGRPRGRTRRRRSRSVPRRRAGKRQRGLTRSCSNDR